MKNILLVLFMSIMMVACEATDLLSAENAQRNDELELEIQDLQTSLRESREEVEALTQDLIMLISKAPGMTVDEFDAAMQTIETSLNKHETRWNELMTEWDEKAAEQNALYVDEIKKYDPLLPDGPWKLALGALPLLFKRPRRNLGHALKMTFEKSFADAGKALVAATGLIEEKKELRDGKDD